MRISVNINHYKRNENMGNLQVWMESHKDGQEDYFVVTNQSKALIFQFTYTWVLGCHKLFLYNEDYDGLLDFMSDDFQTFGEWLFKRLDGIFGCDYDILY